MRALWPYGLVLLLIFASALALGSDNPPSALVFSAALLFLAAALMLSRSGTVSFAGLAWMAGATALLGLGALNGWVSTGAGEYASLMAGAGVFLLARNAALRPERAEALWTAALACGAALGFAAFIDFIVDPRTMFWIERPYHHSRLSTPFLSANTAATFYGVIALMALGAILRSAHRAAGRRAGAILQAVALPLGALLIAATCLFLSGSRAGISVFMVAAIGLFAWDRIGRWRAGETGGARLTLGAAALMVFGLILFGVSGGMYADRIVEAGFGLGADTRGVLFARYPEGVAAAPIFGVGLGGFEYANDFLATAEDARTITAQNAAHNVAFQWLFQTGFAGALGALGVLALILAQINAGLARRRSQRLMLKTVLIVAGFVFAHAMVDYALEIPAFLWLFCLVLGIGAGVAEGGTRRSAAAPTAAPVKVAVSAVFAIAGALSLYAAIDRNLAARTLGLDAAAFRALYPSVDALAGSPARLEAAGDRALRLEPPDPVLAQAAFRASVEAEPRNGKIWAKLAYAAYTSPSRDLEATEAALRQSYLLMPYADRTFVSWRLNFVAWAWPDLSEDVREAAVRESRVLGDGARRQWLERVGRTEDAAA